MENHPPGVSVTAPISPAMQRANLILFRPFDLGKWFAIGFCAFLANLGQGGNGGRYNRAATVKGNASGSQPQMNNYLSHARDYLHANLGWIIPLAVVLFVIVIAVTILLLWLQSRGAFMLLHCVALNRGEVGVPWRKYAPEAHSLWLFRLVLGAVSMVLVLPFIAWLVWMFLAMSANHRQFDLRVILLFVEVGLGWFCISLPLFIASVFTRQFVVPIMYLRGGTCMDAWRILLPILAANAGRFILYILFQIVIGIVVMFLLIAFILCTCCIGAVLLVIPYIGSVVLLPVTIFLRSYSLIYLAQYGPEFDVFRAGENPGWEPIPAA
jgi:hypothetical protein